MAISNKLQTVANSVTDIRTILKACDPTLGAGHINTLDDDIRKIINSTRVVKQNPYRIEHVINNGTTMTAISGDGDVAEIIIPSTVTSIPANGIINCSNLDHLLIPNNITSIGNFAFEGCTSLNLTIDGTCSLGSNVVRDIKKLVFVNRPDYALTNYTFDNMRNTNSIFITDGNVTKSGNFSFGN